MATPLHSGCAARNSLGGGVPGFFVRQHLRCEPDDASPCRESMNDRIIDCCSLVPGCSKALLDATRELRHQLAARYPQVPEIVPQTLDCRSSYRGVHAYLERQLQHCFADEHDESPLADKRLVVLCYAASPLVRLARLANPRAHWGIAVPRRFAIAWVDCKHLRWHEALHLYDARDCYNRFGIHRCPEAKCVMQASPTEVNCGSQLHLFEKHPPTSGGREVGPEEDAR